MIAINKFSFWCLISISLPLVSIVPTELFASSKSQKAMVRMENIEIALYKFGTDNKRLPTTEEGLNALIEPGKLNNNWLGPYLRRKEPPKDPWGNDFKYIYPSVLGGKRFDLYSFGINEKDDFGDKDDIFLGRKINYGFYHEGHNLGYFELISIVLAVDFPIALMVFAVWRLYKRKNKNPT